MNTNPSARCHICGCPPTPVPVGGNGVGRRCELPDAPCTCHQSLSYNDYSHTHCWDQKSPSACGIALAHHKQCCLCDSPMPHQNACCEKCYQGPEPMHDCDGSCSCHQSAEWSETVREAGNKIERLLVLAGMTQLDRQMIMPVVLDELSRHGQEEREAGAATERARIREKVENLPDHYPKDIFSDPWKGWEKDIHTLAKSQGSSGIDNISAWYARWCTKNIKRDLLASLEEEKGTDV